MCVSLSVPLLVCMLTFWPRFNLKESSRYE